MVWNTPLLLSMLLLNRRNLLVDFVSAVTPHMTNGAVPNWRCESSFGIPTPPSPCLPTASPLHSLTSCLPIKMRLTF